MEEDDFLNPVPFSTGVDEIKTTNALYKILEALPESDPLKNKAKEKALAILENLTLLYQVKGWVSLKSLLSEDAQKASIALLRDIGILENYLKIGRGQGWIDAMNFLIITKEYKIIKSNIKLPTGIVKEILSPQNKIPLIGQFSDKTIPKEPVQILNIQRLSLEAAEHPENSKIVARQDSFSPKALVRHTKILEILAKNQKAQVSDLIKELPNITKRTVRRDLDDLLKRGKIMRIGEWNQVFYQIHPVKSAEGGAPLEQFNRANRYIG